MPHKDPIIRAAYTKAYLKKWIAEKKLDPEWVERRRVKGRVAANAYNTRLKACPEKRDALLQGQKERRKLTMREVKVEQHLRDEVKQRGGMCQKWVDTGRRGAPDRLVLLPGHPTYFVELKRPALGKLAPHQARYHEDIRAAGQSVVVLDSIEAVDAFLRVLDI